MQYERPLKIKTMKKIMCLLLLLLTLTSFNVNSELEFNIVGTWQGVDDKEVGYFIFQEDGYAFFEHRGLKIGGKEFDIKGKKGSMSYEIDYASNPMKIDFIVTILEQDETRRLLCIAKKIANDKIKLAVGFTGERPTDFEDNDEMIFTRVKN